MLNIFYQKPPLWQRVAAGFIIRQSHIKACDAVREAQIKAADLRIECAREQFLRQSEI